jgi:adenylate kinase
LNILLFGPPGAGKGTQSSLLTERGGMKHISTGDLFRTAIKDQTALGLKTKAILAKGELVPDDITVGIVQEALSGLGGRSFILDGFPRTVTQADALRLLLKKMSMSLDFVVSLNVPREVLISRLTGRRVCKNCGAVYHSESKPSKSEGVCDVCGGPVVQRPDDQPNAIATRLEAYDSSTRPLKDYYQKRGLLSEVDGTGEAEEIYQRIIRIVR